MRGADVVVGEPVRFDAIVEVPPGAGTVVAAEWDFDGAGEYPCVESRFDGSETRVSFATTHAFAEPGTYFAALRVTSHRQGDVASPFAPRAEPRPRPRGGLLAPALSSISSRCSLP